MPVEIARLRLSLGNGCFRRFISRQGSALSDILRSVAKLICAPTQMASAPPTRLQRSDPNQHTASPGLLRQVGLFDATMIVMGGIVGAGIFINPYVVAQQLHTPVLILGVWIAGGIVAMLGAFIYAELAARMPKVGGQYAYLREAFHPAVGFLYG